MLTLVTATRMSQDIFQHRTLLGQCLPRLGECQTLCLKLTYGNTRSLALAYNEAIDSAHSDDLLVFVHDDVRFDDWLLGQRLCEALKHFDVVGVAGNTRVQPRQVTWYLQPETGQNDGLFVWDHGHLSGAICHGAPSGKLSVYGPTPKAVRLLDGVFLAASAGSLQQSGVRFDPALRFHFYDLDFCLTAHQAGLRLGTWPIALTHASNGESIHSKDWRDARQIYLDKWFHD